MHMENQFFWKTIISSVCAKRPSLTDESCWWCQKKCAYVGWSCSPLTTMLYFTRRVFHQLQTWSPFQALFRFIKVSFQNELKFKFRQTCYNKRSSVYWVFLKVCFGSQWFEGSGGLVDDINTYVLQVTKPFFFISLAV